MSQGDPTDNPLTSLGLDPRSSPEEITEAMRELAEEASPEERRRLQGLWRQLTLHPEDRLRAAFFAHAHPRRGLLPLEGASPQALLRRYRLGGAPPVDTAALLEAPPAVADLVVLPSPQARRDAVKLRWPEVAPGDDPLLKM